MIKKLALIILFISIFWGSSSHAQKFNIKSYSVNDGLPSSNVYDLHTDENGYMWLATSYGLVRYNGKDFMTFGKDHGLKDDLVFDLHFDVDGTIWVSTEFGGVAIFDGESFTYLPELAMIDTMVVNYIFSMRENEIWFGTDKYGVAVWDQESGEIEFINKNSGLPSNQIWDIYSENDTEIWITTMEGIGVFDREIGISTLFTASDGFSGELMYELVRDPMGRKWVATNNGVTIIQPDGTIDRITEVEGQLLDYVYTIEVDNEGTVWVGTERNGLYLFEVDGTTTHIKRRNGLSSNFIYRLIKDADGFIWVATDGNGINLFKDRDFLRYDIETPLFANTITALKITNDNTLWIATENGLSSLVSGNFKNFPISTELFDNDEIWDIEELPNGDLLLLTYSYEFFQFDGEDFFTPEFYNDMLDVYVNDIFIDQDGSIWFAAYQELVHLKNGEYTKYFPPTDNYWQAGLGTIFQDSRGKMWINTEGGLAKFENGSFEYFTEEQGIPGYSVYEVYEDLNNNLWVATSGGIAFLKRENAEAENYTFIPFQQNELTINETVTIHVDFQNGLWQGTNAGIYYYDLNGWDYKTIPRSLHFPLSDHGAKVELNSGARVEDEDGTIWFGTYSSGLIAFTYPKEARGIPSSEPPKIYTRTVLADNEIIFDDIKQSEDLNKLVVPNTMNDVSFLFNAIDYKNPDGLAIRYRLDGYNEDWNEAQDISEIRYTNLPAGNYSLLMQAKSIKSDWSDINTLATFRVLKPFYLTIPFFIFVFIGVGFALYLFVNARIGKIEKRELQRLVDQQTKDLSAALSEKEVLIKEIHHRVKNNLAVVSGLLELQGFRMPAGSAKMAIQESKMRVIAMSKIHENLYQNHDLAQVDFKVFISELIKSIQATMDVSDKNIEVVQYMNSVLLDVNIGIPLGLITNELISNSYKHAFRGKSEGTISIHFNEQEEVYELIVSDDGIGAPDDILRKNRKTLGITLINSLTSQIRGEIEYSNSIGSTFKLSVPKEHQNDGYVLNKAKIF